MFYISRDIVNYLNGNNRNNIETSKSSIQKVVIRSSDETYDAFVNRQWIVDKDNGPWNEHCCYDKYHEFNPFYLTNLDFDLFDNDEIKTYVNEFIMQCQDTLVIDNCKNVNKFLNCITCDSKSIVDIKFYGEVFNYKLPIFSNLKHIYIRSKDVDVSQFIEHYHENLYIRKYGDQLNVSGLNKIKKLNRLMIADAKIDNNIVDSKDIRNLYVNSYVNAEDDMRHVNKIKQMIVNFTDRNSKVVYNSEETKYLFDILYEFKGYLNRIIDIGPFMGEHENIYNCIDRGHEYVFYNMDFEYVDNLLPIKQESLLVWGACFYNCKNIDKIEKCLLDITPIY